MYNSQNDIGYCISTVLKDYSVEMDADICLILCSPLWLGLNISAKQNYFPIKKNEISYLNPLFLENFSVNANCLFIPSRANSKDSFDYLKYRHGNRKKTLVKVAESIVSNTDNNMVNDHYEVVHRPVLAIIDKISDDDNVTDGIKVSLVFSEENQMTIPRRQFMDHWYSETGNMNTDLFRIIPSKNTFSEELIKIKIKSALDKQNLNLRSNNKSLLTGNAVLEFLKNGIEKKVEGYELPVQHQYLWRNKEGIIKLKQDYAKALEKLDFMDEWNDIRSIIESLLKGIEVWKLFFEIINDDSLSEETLLQYYEALIEVENECNDNFTMV
ncbi:MAG: hypothetical protein MUW56_14375 [Chryseobacterium sp.]|uniref:hypothetical protein n=1 Tax=Chryseobacterium sp. TaxID=1871047 RepID=UPI0025C26628|nr:hypothetical protein [Chryseobacterium sp.]MCJ7934772.1 hypothetical protein [Chryseobacterium sp.]